MTGSRIYGCGVYDQICANVDPTHRALRVSVRPTDPGALGCYSLGLASGVMAAGLAANSVVFAFQWNVANSFANVTRVRFSAGTDATAFAQGSAIFALVKATKLPAQYTGGQTLTISGKDQARATRFPATQQQIAAAAAGRVAVANTAALLPGTPAPTLDTNPLAVLVGSVGAAPATVLMPAGSALWECTDPRKQPLELWNGEGFVVQATVPVTGTWKFGVEVDYDELDPARYFGLNG